MKWRRKRAPRSNDDWWRPCVQLYALASSTLTLIEEGSILKNGHSIFLFYGLELKIDSNVDRLIDRLCALPYEGVVGAITSPRYRTFCEDGSVRLKFNDKLIIGPDQRMCWLSGTLISSSNRAVSRKFETKFHAWKIRIQLKRVTRFSVEGVMNFLTPGIDGHPRFVATWAAIIFAQFAYRTHPAGPSRDSWKWKRYCSQWFFFVFSFVSQQQQQQAAHRAPYKSITSVVLLGHRLHRAQGHVMRAAPSTRCGRSKITGIISPPRYTPHLSDSCFERDIWHCTRPARRNLPRLRGRFEFKRRKINKIIIPLIRRNDEWIF